MKKLIVFVLVIFAGLSLVSCEKDDNGKSLLAGEWKVTDIQLLDNRGQIMPDTHNWLEAIIECNFSLNLAENGEFNEKGTCDVVTNLVLSGANEGKYTTNGIFITFKSNNTSREYSYSVSSTSLKLTYTPEGKVGTDDGEYTMVITYKKI